MKPEEGGLIDEDERKIIDLVHVLSATEQELQRLTGGHLDSVAGPGGKPYLLADAQEQLRTSEQAQRHTAETLTAILEALPGHIALIDPHGMILRVNQTWEHFAAANSLPVAGYGVGTNYLEACEKATGNGASDAHAAAAGIRSVLHGAEMEFQMEYPCHSPRRQQWFRLTVTPVRKDRRAGAVVMHLDVTERRLAAETLRVTMEEFRTLAEAMPQIVWMARPDGWNTYFNEHWINYTGLTIEESLGDGWRKPFHPDDSTQAWEAWQAATRAVSDFEVEMRLRRADGEYRWWLIRCVPQLNAGGRVLKWFGTCTDIHDLKMAELEISRKNRALTMLSACNEQLVRARQEQEFLDAICRIAVESGGYRMAWVGFAREDAGSSIEPIAFAGHEEGYFKGIGRISWSQDVPEGCGPAGRAIRGGRPEVTEDLEADPYFAPWMDLARARRYRGLVCLPLRNQQRTFGILALYSQTILKLEAEEMKLLMELADDLAFGLEHFRALKETENHAALLDAASDAIIQMDINLRILFWNQGAERMYGWRASEVVGDDPRNIYVCDTAKYNESVQLLMQDGTWLGEHSMRRKDGRQITVDTRWTLLRDEEGEPKSILAINTDITERKKLEAQLMRIQRIESIGTLASGIAHDLNNALSPILMGSSVLRDEVSSSLGRQVLDSIEMAAQHGASLVSQVLSFARGIEGRRFPINIVNLLYKIHEMIRDTFPKNIEFALSAGSETWKVVGDPTHLHQVFTNLCVNARDAMPRGGRLNVSTENVVVDDVYVGMNPEAVPGNYVAVKVEDSGTGVPRAIRDKIFDPFFTTKEVGKGTGLGLSTTLGIVRSHGGFIDLQSEVGKGTVFIVYLPADTSAHASDGGAAELMDIPHGNGEMLLLVDDEPTIRSIAQKTLERNGYRVMLAANGAEAVALYAQHRDEIAIVLTDMSMPVMDGPTTIVALRSMNPALKIIGSSGMASGDGIARAIGAGVLHFIPKPYTAETILKTIAMALRG